MNKEEIAQQISDCQFMQRALIHAVTFQLRDNDVTAVIEETRSKLAFIEHNARNRLLIQEAK